MPKIFLHKNCQTGKLALGGLGEFSLPVRPRTSAQAWGCVVYVGTLQSPSLTTAHIWPGCRIRATASSSLTNRTNSPPSTSKGSAEPFENRALRLSPPPRVQLNLWQIVLWCADVSIHAPAWGATLRFKGFN